MKENKAASSGALAANLDKAERYLYLDSRRRPRPSRCSRPGSRHGLDQLENVRHLPTPFGGMKASGIGRDGGDYSFDFYMETKNVAIAYDSHKVPKIGG
jgi:hypothetical protein